MEHGHPGSAATAHNQVPIPIHGYLFAGGSAVASAITTVLGKWNLRVINPLLLNCLIFTTATAIMTLMVLFSRHRKQALWHSRAGRQALAPAIGGFREKRKT